MTDTNKYKKFEASSVALESSNLIEASAGTGKTYSIAILVLRLILEQKLSIREILMVTFTKAAVAELEARIRLFIREAYKASREQPIQDGNIRLAVAQAVETSTAAVVQEQLRDAILLLDETSVLTIHSFCQQTLTEFAFETKQLFGSEMAPDLTPVVEDELNKYWRTNITTLQTAFLEMIWHEGMKADIRKVLQDHLGGKRYSGFDEGEGDGITVARQNKWLEALHLLANREQEGMETICAYITDNAASLKAACEANRYTKKDWPDLIATPEKFIAKIQTQLKKKPKYFDIVFPEILIRLNEVAGISNEAQELLGEIRRQLYAAAVKSVTAAVQLYKALNNTLDYDDLIANLHHSLVKANNPALVAALQKKYKAVFVDEFQDTDRQQFEIFNRAFGQNTILFYIGDPKQSIYAWRKADIFTYFKARNSVEHLYGMNHNFRSAENLIRAMNLFFKPHPGFDTFDFNGESDSIEYIAVESPPDNSKGYLKKDGQIEVPIEIITADKKEVINEAVAAQVAQLLLDTSRQISNQKGDRPVTAQDIGILVRTGKEGKAIKHTLAALGIPAITIDDSKVLETPEAVQVLHLLEAMETPERSAINRALLSSFTGFGTNAILQLDDELTLDLFSKYRGLWLEDGAYTALQEFIADFNVRNVLMGGAAENGERVITNLYQLAELIHEAQSRKNLSMRDLISWLKRSIDGMTNEGDVFVQRMESDEEAVNIVTIHKSKGLEYKIVLAPFLDFTARTNGNYVSFRDPATGDYLVTERNRLTEDRLQAYSKQQEQENRRLIYVAITRAVYKCYLFRNSYWGNSSLATFLNALKTAQPDPELIRLRTSPLEKPAKRYPRQHTSLSSLATSSPVSFHLNEENWRKMSYSMLTAKTERQPRLRSFQQTDAYDNFIFTTLRRGAKTGNLLHYIFENINFSDPAKWTEQLEEAIRLFIPGQRNAYLDPLYEMLQQVMHANILLPGGSFQLASVGRHQRLSEFEFDFPVPAFQPQDLDRLSDGERTIMTRRYPEYNNQELEGIMNGKIDLFFEQDGRYYILDWKSNYLGNKLADYGSEGLAAAMNENNYHLQYLIYTVAVKKYLETRIPDFHYPTRFGGVIYCFIRGMRKASSSGIYFCKPESAKIDRLEKLLT